MKKHSLDQYLIEHCAATLAGIKSVGLFSCRFFQREELLQELKLLNNKLNNKGVYLELMQWKDDYALIYVYRLSHLEKDLQKEGVEELLAYYDYPVGENVKVCLAYLKERLIKCNCFPHEIGIFLGYPLDDVKGFIIHKGRDCKCCGLWKVYCNECETMKLFAKIQKCTRVYLEVFAQGRHIIQMTVCA